jgi:hypothetical protein
LGSSDTKFKLFVDIFKISNFKEQKFMKGKRESDGGTSYAWTWNLQI